MRGPGPLQTICDGRVMNHTGISSPGGAPLKHPGQNGSGNAPGPWSQVCPACARILFARSMASINSSAPMKRHPPGWVKRRTTSAMAASCPRRVLPSTAGTPGEGSLITSSPDNRNCRFP